MARCILVLFFLLSALLAHQFEFIRTSYQGKDITLSFVNGKEVFALIGNDQVVLEKAVSVLSQLQLFGELKYSTKELNWKKRDNRYFLFWDNELIVDISQEEMNLNNKRRNDIKKSAVIFESPAGDKIELGGNQNNGLISSMKLTKRDLISFDGILPAVHKHYPLGTTLRLHNKDTDWTVVTKIVDNDKNLEEDTLGVNENTLKALGIKNGKIVKVLVL